MRGPTIRIFDNGGETFDRYTVVYMRTRHKNYQGYLMYDCLGMSEHPFHPQGFGQHTECQVGKHLGTEISFGNLPPDCQRAVIQDVREGLV